MVETYIQNKKGVRVTIDRVQVAHNPRQLQMLIEAFNVAVANK
jgi:CRISPR/Cas system CSM-associated protein Csm3 (group 7 of RAMP superfamily)